MDEITDNSPVQAQVAVGARRGVLWLIAGAVLVLGAGAVAAVFLLGGDDEAVAAKPWVPPERPNTFLPRPNGEVSTEAGVQSSCLDHGGKQTVVAYFDGKDPDPAMRLVAEALKGDERIAWVKTETRQEAFERFKLIFAQHPELIKLARPEALPASVELLPADGVYAGDIANAITGRFPEIESLDARCELPK